MQEFQRGSPLEKSVSLGAGFTAKKLLVLLAAQKNKPSSLEGRIDSGQARMTRKRDPTTYYLLRTSKSRKVD